MGCHFKSREEIHQMPMIRSVCLHINDRSTQSETTKDEQVMIVKNKVRAEELARQSPILRAQKALLTV